MAWVAPHNCLVCEREGGLLCAWCQPDACLPLPDRCFRCQKISHGSRVCTNCRRICQLGYVWVATSYEGAAKELLHKFKFERAKSGAQIIANYLDERLPYLKPATLVSFVPTSPQRARLRGYDQAELIGQEFARRRGLTCLRLLARVGRQRQVGANRQLRLSQLEHSFMALNPSRIKEAKILLIDDVVTTGGTLSAAAKVFKQAGAKSVDAATFAQSL